MKKHGRDSGFTLIELLAVIVIIMILMGMIMVVVRDALRDARMQRARSEAWEIHNAVQAFFHEYGSLPLPNQEDHGRPTGGYGSDGWYGSDDELTRIYDILSGNDETVNPREIVFLRRRANEDDDEPPLRDPWGNPYRIAMDTTYGGSISTRGEGISLEGIVTVRSYGPNGVADSPRIGRGFDDIITGLEL